MSCGSFRRDTGVAGPGEPGGVLPDTGADGTFLQSSGGLWVPSAYALPTAAPAVNQVLVGNGTNMVYADHAPARSYLLFGCGASVLNNTSFLYSGGGGGPNNSVTPITSLIAKTGVLYAATVLGAVVRHNAPLGATNITYTILKNGASSGMTVVLASNATIGSTTANTFSVAAGDDLAVQCDQTSGGSLGVRPTLALALLIL